MAHAHPHAAPRPRRGAAARILTAVTAAAVTGLLAAGCGQVPAEPVGAGAPTAATPEPKASGEPSAGPSATPAASAKPSAPAASATATAQPSTEAKSAAKSKKSAKPKPRVIFAPGDSGERIRELQARLKQLNWFSGKVTEHYGNQTTTAVRGFQRKRDLPATGSVDETTWGKLTAMTRQPTQDELHNRVPAGPPILQVGDESRKVRELQARLKQLDWFSERVTGYYGDVTASAVKGFQDKRGLPATGAVDQRTWDRLVGMTKEPSKDELDGNDANNDGNNDGNDGATQGLDQRCLTGRAMCIDKSTNQLVWVIDGRPQLRFDVRFGSSETPTREGAFSVGWKAEEWTSTLYDSEMPYSMFFSGGQAVHYSSDFAARGYSGASHGCVNVRDLAGIKTLFYQVQVGDKVIVYRS